MEYTLVTEKELTALIAEERSELSGLEFSELDLTNTLLKNAVFVDCKFSRCNLANTSLLNVVLRSVVFENCNLMGINWTEVRKNGDYSFSSCKLDYGCFQSVDLRGFNFENSSIREADFSGANLSKANLKSTMLAGTSFTNANLEKADFRPPLNRVNL